MKTFVICLVALATLTGTAVGLSCYKCFNGEDCEDPFNAAGAEVEQCLSEDSRCRTWSQEIGDIFTRGCVSASDCYINGCYDDACYYCCDEDLCNSQSIAEVTMDTLECYSCSFLSSYSDNTKDTGPCGEPFDPNGDGVFTLPCDGKCMISVIPPSFGSGKIILRQCAPWADVSEFCRCRPNDAIGPCATCCSDNLCNDGPLPVSPSGARKTMLDQTVAKCLLLVLLVALGCM